MNKKDTPLKLLKCIVDVKDFFRGKLVENSFIQLYRENSDSLYIIDNEANSKFFFQVDNPQLINGNAMFDVEFAPQNNVSIAPYKSQVSADGVKGNFNAWLNYISEYNSISLLPEDEILKTYEDEFMADFEIIDNNAEHEPFSLEQQLLLDKYLEFLETTLEDHHSEEGIAIILDETRSLRKLNTRLTKKAFIRSLSKILSKMRRYGLPLIKEVYSEVKKELIKRAIAGSFDGIEHLLKH